MILPSGIDKPLVWLHGEIKTPPFVILEVFAKKTAQTPHRVLANCRNRLRLYESFSDE